MRKISLSILLLFFCVGLVGCSNKEEVSKQAKIDPNKLLETLQNDSPLVPLGDIPVPVDNPMTPEVVKLGQTLFFDPRLSGNNERSCATCHDSSLGYGDGRPTLKMYDGSDGARNSPTIINSGYYTSNFWDGRASSLEEQALGPIQNPNEMNQKLDELIQELKGITGYEDLFLAAFNDGITEKNLAKALAAFERQIVVKDTPYDQFLQGDTTALNQQELRGLSLFSGKAYCSKCHNGPNLSDNNFYNTGLNSEDEGRFALTKKIGDMGKFRTAGLYGITHTAPYMRDGSIATLKEVINYYNRGGGEHPNKSFYLKNFMSPLDLTKQEKEDLLAFLKSLGGNPPIFTKPVLPGITN
ncbi:cytochrome-c peroxidase [Bacillus sp. 1NLA3E]|uniref:cytochrome-c peroxidase n=1 Tax=Bacillus sp. 1NLA3E TaxID=666686 RepID=UPI000247ED00|nr:cytochrome c peroxidase [Bacillus sp. 1NLA3E]AGK53495.1 Cytochrome-c peroxidase [Bacillus sp. 1NLA3E]